MGIPFVIGFVLLGLLSGNSPDYKSSNSKILDWYASHGHRVADIAGILVLAVSAAFFIWFVGHLRATLSSAEGAGGRAASIALASGTAFITLLAVAGSSFTAIAFVVSEAGSEFTLEPNTFRLLSGFGFLTYVVALMFFTFITTLIYIAWILLLSGYLAFRPFGTRAPAAA